MVVSCSMLRDALWIRISRRKPLCFNLNKERFKHKGVAVPPPHVVNVLCFE